MKELSIKEKAKAYDEALERAKRLYEQGTITESLSYVFPQLKKLGDEEVRKEIMQLIQGMYDADPRKERWLAWLEKQGQVNETIISQHENKTCKENNYSLTSEDERIRKDIKQHFLYLNDLFPDKGKWLAWLEKHGVQKEINLVEILKHYPKETELYSPLYGKLWLAEVDEKSEIIICYKHHLEEGCVRAVLSQEDTVAFFSDGTTGLPDFNVSKDCVLFLYDIEKQSEENLAWSNKDEEVLLKMMFAFKARVFPSSEECDSFIDFLKSLKNKVQPKQKWSDEDECYMSGFLNLTDD